MGNIVDLTGKKFYKWTVIKLSHQKGKVLYWKCVCECGTERAVFGGDLKRGGSRSCGCLHIEILSARLTSHNMSRHGAYKSWIHMRGRCENPNGDEYNLYGGRGIKVCERWAEFINFWHDMKSTWKQGLSIDRIDVNGHYEPENCRWATPLQQANNRRTNHKIDTPKGKMNIGQASKVFGINSNTIFARIRYGWPEKELLRPVEKRRKNEE